MPYGEIIHIIDEYNTYAVSRVVVVVQRQDYGKNSCVI